jgi:hypothetical protein
MQALDLELALCYLEAIRHGNKLQPAGPRERMQVLTHEAASKKDKYRSPKTQDNLQYHLYYTGLRMPEGTQKLLLQALQHAMEEPLKLVAKPWRDPC